MNVEKIYFDLDNTVADFGRGLRDMCNMEEPPQATATEEQEEAMWQAIREQGDFYLRLKEFAPGAALFRKLRNKYNYGSQVEILSSIPSKKRNITAAAGNKRAWVREHLDKDHSGSETVVNLVSPASEKTKFAKGKDYILIDDYESNIKQWNEAGGTGFWFNKQNPEETIKKLEEAGILSKLAYTLKDDCSEMNLKEYINFLLENTDAEGNLYLPDEDTGTLHPEIKDYYHYSMDWDKNKVEELLCKLERLQQAANEINNSKVLPYSTPEEAKEKLSEYSYSVWNDYYRYLDDTDYDERIPEIEDKLDSIVSAKECSQTLAEGKELSDIGKEIYEECKDIELTPEEEELINAYYESLSREAEKRLGEGAFPHNLIRRFHRYMKLLEMGIAPDCVVEHEWKMFARALAVFLFCKKAEFIEA